MKKEEERQMLRNSFTAIGVLAVAAGIGTILVYFAWEQTKIALIIIGIIAVIIAIIKFIKWLLL